MCPLHLIPKIFLFDEEEVAPEVRAQRTLNRARVPELARYISENREQYVFSALTASIDGEVAFEALGDDEVGRDIGKLHVPMSARFLINDGQHRRAAIVDALEADPELGDESIAVVFFEDRGLERAQQMFTDLNQHAVRPSRSLGLLYDHRSDRAWLAKEVAARVETFRGRIELEKSAMGVRSAKMFTLSAIETATTALLADHREMPLEKQANLAIRFWSAVADQIPEWRQMRNKTLNGGEFRRDFVCAHGIALSALAHTGRALLLERPDDWATCITGLRELDWSRSNPDWEGRAMVSGRLRKSHMNTRLTASLLKRFVGMELSQVELDDERRASLPTADMA